MYISLSARVMASLRQPGRGRYTSERSWLAEDNATYTTADIGSALALLEATKRIMRADV
jgi:hypothetical protein